MHAHYVAFCQANWCVVLPSTSTWPCTSPVSPTDEVPSRRPPSLTHQFSRGCGGWRTPHARSIQPTTSSAFGKLLLSVFPHVSSRRVGASPLSCPPPACAPSSRYATIRACMSFLGYYHTMACALNFSCAGRAQVSAGIPRTTTPTSPGAPPPPRPRPRPPPRLRPRRRAVVPRQPITGSAPGGRDEPSSRPPTHHALSRPRGCALLLTRSSLHTWQQLMPHHTPRTDRIATRNGRCTSGTPTLTST